MLTRIFHATSFTSLPSFKETHSYSPLGDKQRFFVEQQREQIKRILLGQDSRLLVIIGPCSIHDPIAALDYAKKLAAIQHEFADTLKIVMRTYFEKPRTRFGWKGFGIDPDLDGQHNIAKGIALSRQLLNSILDLHVPTATEFLDPCFAPYLADMICWGAIGARTTESQPHRQLVSALHCPVGFKNSTNGNIDHAIDAIHASRMPQSLIQCNSEGCHVVIHSPGNQYGHLILRGGDSPNYTKPHVQAAAFALKRNDLTAKLIVDFSHGNSQKAAHNQLNVASDIAAQIQAGDDKIVGIMCESFLQGGQQPSDQRPLNYGQSITDECLGWQDSVDLLQILHRACIEKSKRHQSTMA